MMPARETERMMKLQDVILKAMAKKLTWVQAAEIAGMSVRNMQRMRQRYQEHDYKGLFDRRRGKNSYHRVPMEKAERVLALYQDVIVNRSATLWPSARNKLSVPIATSNRFRGSIQISTCATSMKNSGTWKASG